LKLSGKKNIVCYCIIAVIFAASLVVWYFIYNAEIENPVAKIYKNGVLIEIINISDYDLRFSFTVGTPETGINEIKVKNGEIWVGGITDCLVQTCVKTGHIGSNGRTIPIICVPNRLEIRIVGGENIHELDAVAR